MSTLTTLPVGLGYFFGYFPSYYAVAIGSQVMYDALADGIKSGIKGGYSDVSSFMAWLNIQTLEDTLNVILLEPMNTSDIPASKDGQTITIYYMYQGIENNYSYSYSY